MDDDVPRSQLVHRDTAWILEHFTWLDRNFSGYVAGRRLVLPSKEFYPSLPPSEDPETLAAHVFEITKIHMGLHELPTRLEPYEDAAERTNFSMPALVQVSGSGSAAGLFRLSKNAELAVIQYRRSLVSDFESLVATFAHELSHLLLCHAKDDPPSGWGDLEPITDLTAVFSGFGLFLMNSCTKFFQFTTAQSQGWGMSTQGYLGSQSLASGLALFLKAKGIDPTHVGDYLGRNGSHDLKTALSAYARPEFEGPLDHLRSKGVGYGTPQLVPTLRKPFWQELKTAIFGPGG